MIQKPLSHHSIVETADVDEARAAVREVYLENLLTPLQRDGVHMRLNAWDDGDFTLGFLSYGGDIALQMPAPDDCYHVNLTIAGTTKGSRGDHSEGFTQAGQSGLVLLPHHRTTVNWAADAEQLIFRLSRRLLEQHAADTLGRPVERPIEFDFQLDLTTPSGQSLLASTRFMAAELDRPGGLADNPLALGHLRAFVLNGILMTASSSLRDALSTPGQVQASGQLRAVLEHIHDHLDEPLTPVQLARVGTMSLRSLHATFHDVLDTSPMAYVRELRLESVRQELIKSSCPDLKVGEVAMKWGFFHVSRFSAHYKQKYGELPSETRARHL